MNAAACRGRFAPSPTGPLHLGSLVAALASYLDARSNGGAWLVRIEDIDLVRCVSGADEEILRTLHQFGFRWDETVVRQSQRTPLYRDALDRLRGEGHAYPCSCTRREAGGRYPGTCRTGIKDCTRPVAWRTRDEAEGDFVVCRSDGLFAYQLAVVVDDAAQGITDVVRGADLLDSTPRQNLLQRLLGYPIPRYLHIPLVPGPDGRKLSKQTLAPAVRAENALALVNWALRFLGQPAQQGATPAEILRAATACWNAAAIPAHGNPLALPQV